MNVYASHLALSDTFMANFYPHAFHRQPIGNEMGKITNHLKTNVSTYHTLENILDKFSNGYCGVICQTDYNLQFISTKLISVDIDDDNRITNPIDVFHQFNAAGLFYTFSHGIKGNRYRLIFQLSEIMTDAKKVNAITKQLTKNMQQKGIPVDTNPTNIYLPVRGGNHAEYKINSDNVLDIDPLITQAEKAAQFKSDKLMKNIKKDYVSIPFKYLKEMAQSIGYIASNTNQYDKWMRIVYAIKYYDQMNHITYKQGLELFQMISGNESSEEEYKHLHPTGDVTIASFIHYAMESGYQSDYFFNFYENVRRTPNNYDEYILHVNRYIPMETSMDLLTRKKKYY